MRCCPARQNEAQRLRHLCRNIYPRPHLPPTPSVSTDARPTSVSIPAPTPALTLCVEHIFAHASFTMGSSTTSVLMRCTTGTLSMAMGNTTGSCSSALASTTECCSMITPSFTPTLTTTPEPHDGHQQHDDAHHGGLQQHDAQQHVGAQVHDSKVHLCALRRLPSLWDGEA
ncbi:unnamed protein product [Prorocentrum cordatum]|uniref:Uncharacterized protein n=1 Tax=Prorocentrum cordatum TaxID=2364126 RepID=A0ABN9TCT6_9DINO|nr:unnamed protein product [Polarella glacialis]